MLLRLELESLLYGSDVSDDKDHDELVQEVRFACARVLVCVCVCVCVGVCTLALWELPLVIFYFFATLSTQLN